MKCVLGPCVGGLAVCRVQWAATLNQSLEQSDPELFDIMEREKHRQRTNLVLIASEVRVPGRAPVGACSCMSRACCRRLHRGSGCARRGEPPQPGRTLWGQGCPRAVHSVLPSCNAQLCMCLAERILGLQSGCVSAPVRQLLAAPVCALLACARTGDRTLRPRPCSTRWALSCPTSTPKAIRVPGECWLARPWSGNDEGARTTWRAFSPSDEVQHAALTLWRYLGNTSGG
jgi:hypothetical protein